MITVYSPFDQLPVFMLVLTVPKELRFHISLPSAFIILTAGLFMSSGNTNIVLLLAGLGLKIIFSFLFSDLTFSTDSFFLLLIFEPYVVLAVNTFLQA